MRHIGGWHKKNNMCSFCLSLYLHSSRVRQHSWGHSQKGLQSDKTHLRQRIWCIHSTVVKISVCWPCTLPAKPSGIKPGEFNPCWPMWCSRLPQLTEHRCTNCCMSSNEPAWVQVVTKNCSTTTSTTSSNQPSPRAGATVTSSIPFLFQNTQYDPLPNHLTIVK